MKYKGPTIKSSRLTEISAFQLWRMGDSDEYCGQRLTRQIIIGLEKMAKVNPYPRIFVQSPQQSDNS